MFSETTIDHILANVNVKANEVSFVQLNDDVKNAYLSYLSTLPPQEIPDDKHLEAELWMLLKTAYDRRNSGVTDKNGNHHRLSSREQWHIKQELNPTHVAELMLRSHHIANIVMAEDIGGSDGTALGMYQEDGPERGTWSLDEKHINNIVWEYLPSCSDSDLKAIKTRLRAKAPDIERTKTPWLVAVNNGIWDYRKKELLPFSPDYVFTTKSNVDFNPNAKNVHILMPNGQYWDFDSWLASLTDSPDMESLLWEIISAVLRPNVAWNKAVFMYSETGNNGKGTFCRLLRNILGRGASTSIAVRNFDKDFMLEPLLSAQAIITDENSTDTFLQDADNFKAVITGDPISINRKHKRPIVCQYSGLMIQCFNGLPRLKDHTDSIYRRQLFVPMTKCFTGAEIKEIKADYLKRREVLEYVLYRALMSDFDEFSNPQQCQDALNSYKEYNDPVREFFNEVICDQGSLAAYDWDLLYKLYEGWLAETNPNARPEKRYNFKNDVFNLVKASDDWECGDTRTWQFRVNSLMAGSEPLIAKYNITTSMRPNTKAGTKDSYTDIYPDHSTRIRGIRRKLDHDGNPMPGRPHHVNASLGTDMQRVDHIGVDDVRVQPDGSPRLKSGAPVPADILAAYIAQNPQSSAPVQAADQASDDVAPAAAPDPVEVPVAAPAPVVQFAPTVTPEQPAPAPAAPASTASVQHAPATTSVMPVQPATAPVQPATATPSVPMPADTISVHGMTIVKDSAIGPDGGDGGTRVDDEGDRQ